ncbi:MAG: ribbon-helix-helix domain-containing protein [Nanopusillaceae archaeon]
MPRKQNSENMVLVSLYIPHAILDLIDRMVKLGYYSSRSEAIRELLRIQLLYLLNHGEICRKLTEQLEAEQTRKRKVKKPVEEHTQEQEDVELDGKLIPGRI